MFDLFFAMIAAGMNATAAAPSADAAIPAADPPAVVTPAPSTQTVQIAPDSVTIGQGTIIQGTPTPAAPLPDLSGSTTPAFNMAVVPTGLVADPQTPSGKFTTAAEVKPILAATKGNWVAVRDYEGKDHLYITHLWSWRCGLKAIAISINEEPMQNWPMPGCHTQFATPNAVLPDDGLPYLRFKQGAVRTITIQIVYDDLSMDVGTFERANVLIP